MKIAVTGASGRIGSQLVMRGCEPLVCDITKRGEVEDAIALVCPDVIIHAEAMTNVDYCQHHQDEARLVNMTGAANVFRAAEGIPVVLMSSDHVFAGSPFLPGEKHATEPKNYYGLTKLGAESAAEMYDAHVVRTSVLFSSPLDNYYSKNAMSGETTEVPSCIQRTFMYIDDFVDALMRAVSLIPHNKLPRILHISGSERVSWYDFVKYGLTVSGYDTSRLVRRTSYISAQHVANRPQNGGLNTKLARSLGIITPSYKDGIDRWKRQSA